MTSQLLANALVAASLYALVAVGFGLIYSASRFFNFAHGMVLTGSAYMMYALHTYAGFPLLLSAALGVTFGTLLGCSTLLIVYRPLMHRKASHLTLLLASLGIYIVFQNLISAVFGDGTESVRSDVVVQGIAIGGARVTHTQLASVFISLALIVTVILLLRWTKLGKAMRALSSDPELAQIVGINTGNVMLFTFAIGSALAGVAGALAAIDVDMTPTMGMSLLLMGIVAVIAGGVRSIPGSVMGSLLVGIARNYGAWWLGFQWQDAMVFTILLGFLLFRPQGFLGIRSKKASV